MSITLGEETFRFANKVILEGVRIGSSDSLDLPNLESIDLGDGSFCGNDRNNMNILIMKSKATKFDILILIDLPHLKSIKNEEGNSFNHMNNVTLESNSRFDF